MLARADLEAILAAAPRLAIGVIGDLFLDRYLEIDTGLTELSLETGLEAFQVTRVRAQPGAAGTIINNLAALGVGRIVVVSLLGDDGEGYELRQALAALPVDTAGLLIRSDRRTPTYTKPMLQTAGQPAREWHRLDIKNRTPTAAAAEADLVRAVELAWSTCAAWIVLDQVTEADCGVVTARVRSTVERLAGQHPRFVLADSRCRIGSFRGLALKPNRRECLAAQGGADLPAAAAALAQQNAQPVFCTAAEQGILLAMPGQVPQPLPAMPVSGPIDPVGAGDSVSAALAVACAAGQPPAVAAVFANLIAAITVQQIGTTGTANPEQVRAAWQLYCGSG